jgi:hypothetical protein
MPVDFRSQGPNWRQYLRENDIFVALMTEHYARDRRCQRQLAYARQLGKKVIFLVKAGTVWTELRQGEVAYTWATQEDLNQLVIEIARGER